MFLNFLMVQKLIFPYIPYMVKCNFNCNKTSMTYMFKNQYQISQTLYSLNIPYTVKRNFNCNKTSMTYRVKKSANLL